MYDALTGAAGLTSAPAASGAPARHANLRGFHTAGAEPEGRGRSTDAKARAQKGSCGGRPLDAGHGFGAEGWRRDPPRRARGVDAPATSRRLPASPAATPVSTLSRPSWAATKPKRTACPPARQHRGPQRTYRHPQPRPPATPHLRATPTRPLQRSTTRTGQVTMTVTADLEVPAASPGREEARDPCVSPAAPEEPMRRWISPCCGRPGPSRPGKAPWPNGQDGKGPRTRFGQDIGQERRSSVLRMPTPSAMPPSTRCRTTEPVLGFSPGIVACVLVELISNELRWRQDAPVGQHALVGEDAATTTCAGRIARAFTDDHKECRECL